MVVFAREPFSWALVEEIKPLLVRHREEVSIIPEDVVLDPDYARYEQLHNCGFLRIFTARKEGKLVGYLVFLVLRTLHYDMLSAEQDVLYLASEERKGYTGRDLIRFAGKEMIEKEGVRQLQHRTKPGRRDLSVLLKREGYECTELVYTKEVR